MYGRKAMSNKYVFSFLRNVSIITEDQGIDSKLLARLQRKHVLGTKRYLDIYKLRVLDIPETMTGFFDIETANLKRVSKKLNTTIILTKHLKTLPNGRSVPYALRLCNKLPIPIAKTNRNTNSLMPWCLEHFEIG